jgi:hypothetical protein
MERNVFFQTLGDLSPARGYVFNVEDNNIVGEITRGPNKGQRVNPVTALAYRQTGAVYGTNKRETQKAGRSLGLSSDFIEQLYAASVGSSNRGNTQVMRGKIRSALGV